MCRNIKTLHNFEPPPTTDEIRASSLQFVRKLCGFTKPSQANEVAFNRAVDEVAHVAQHLLDSLVDKRVAAKSRNGSLESAGAIGKTFRSLPHNGQWRIRQGRAIYEWQLRLS